MFGGSEMAPTSKKMASKTCSKTDAKNDAKIDRILMPNGANMEPKRHQTFNVFLARFSEASGNIVDGASAERRGSHFLQRIPQGGAILSKNTVE